MKNLDIPDTQAVLETFMTHKSKLADVEYQVQGPGELRCKDRVSYCCHIISIYYVTCITFVVLDPTDLGATIVVAPGQMPGGFLPSPDADCLPF